MHLYTLNQQMVVFTMVTSTSVVIIGAPWFTASWSHWCMKTCVQPDGVSDTGGLWNCLPVPDEYFAYHMGMVGYGKFLICLTSSGDLHALSPETESWVHVGRLDTGRWDLLMTLCTGEIVALTMYWRDSCVTMNDYSPPPPGPWRLHNA